MMLPFRIVEVEKILFNLTKISCEFINTRSVHVRERFTSIQFALSPNVIVTPRLSSTGPAGRLVWLTKPHLG